MFAVRKQDWLETSGGRTAVISCSSRCTVRQNASRSGKTISTLSDMKEGGDKVLTEVVQVVVEGILAKQRWPVRKRPWYKAELGSTHISWPISRKPSSKKDANAVPLRRDN